MNTRPIVWRNEKKSPITGGRQNTHFKNVDPRKFTEHLPGAGGRKWEAYLFALASPNHNTHLQTILSK